jgi:hypothetical protein
VPRWRAALAAEADVPLIVVDLMQIWRTINHDHETSRFHQAEVVVAKRINPADRTGAGSGFRLSRPGRRDTLDA